MRYAKGMITLSETRDYPLLRRVLHSGLATAEQLYEFMQLDYCASSRNEFGNRLRRLVDHGMICRHELRTVNRGIVYSLAPAGASELIGRGEYYTRHAERAAGLSWKVHHALELNEIHLALKRTGTLVRWTAENEIRSSNELTSMGYVKDYDALVAVRIEGQECSFALEYERTPKAKRRYDVIRERIERETRAGNFLYLLPNHDLLQFVMRRFAGCPRAVHFGLRQEFLAETLNLQVQSGHSPISMAFRTVLKDQWRQRAGSAARIN
jgi:hypothetical protein